jgi:hypothetical protein
MQNKLMSRSRKFSLNLILLLLFNLVVNYSLYIRYYNYHTYKFYFGIIIFTFLLIFFIYSVFYNAKIINNTIDNIQLINDEIKITTFSFNVFFLFHYREKEFYIERSSSILSLSKIEYPLKGIEDFEENCYKLSIKNFGEFYLFKKIDQNFVILGNDK